VKELSKRLMTGLIGIILLFLVIKQGGIYLSLSLLLLSLVGINEFYSVLEKLHLNPIRSIGYLGTLGLFLINMVESISIELFIVLVTISLFIILMRDSKLTISDISVTALGLLYIPFLLGHIFYLDGTKYIWLIFIIAFGTDTFAYMFGNIFGKTKLSPNISPNKTIEGSLGGIFGSLVCSIIYASIIGIGPKWKIVILSIFISIIAQLGDLVASRIKRMANIKDYGFVFPGHGGVLDRFDSIIFSAPLIYYYVQYFLI